MSEGTYFRKVVLYIRMTLRPVKPEKGMFHFAMRANRVQNEQLLTESKLSSVCERVLDRCLAPSTAGGEGCDNMTMILVQFEKPFQSGASLVEELPASSEKPPAPSEANTETKPAECRASTFPETFSSRQSIITSKAIKTKQE
ncbi:hypothetical protein RND71_042570 [Anisodus tanguticus]|uniref:Uncharacterized protein n=1 Tax=Anisodus tanguticus TaxID=243964 RepID=A0AAE1QR40_9SOLA|nr:hypothetical protein RND71_042570 [Anisodus tanguticus]